MTTTPTERIEQTTAGLRHFIDHLNQYAATVSLISEDELRHLERAATILDRLAQRRETARLSLNTDWAFTQRLEDEGAEGIPVALREGRLVMARSWWETHDNISFLAQHLASHGESAENIADMVEKPWQWTGEYQAALDEHEMELAGEKPAGYIEDDTPNNRKDTP